MTNKLYKPLLIDSVLATEDLIQNRFVGFDGKICKEGAKALGVADTDTANEQYAPVAAVGILLVEAGGIFAEGDAITSDENGRAIKATENAEINGYARDNATEGEMIRILRGI